MRGTHLVQQRRFWTSASAALQPWQVESARRSKDWGVMPWHWYFTSVLPRALMAAMPLTCVGAGLERRVRPLVAAAAAFVVLYSFLGHKEVRSRQIRCAEA